MKNKIQGKEKIKTESTVNDLDKWDIKMEYIKIKNCSYIDGERDWNRCFKGYCQLSISKN